MQCRQSTDNCKIKLETLYHCTAAFIATRKHTGTGAVEKGKAGQGSDKAVIRGPTRTSGTGQGLDAWTSSLHRVEKKGHTDDKAWTKWRRPTARPRLSRGGHQDTGRRTAGETPRGHQENTGLASAAKGGHEEGPQAWDTGFGQRLGENPNRKLFGENLIALIREWFKDLAEFTDLTYLTSFCGAAKQTSHRSHPPLGLWLLGKTPTKEKETRKPNKIDLKERTTEQLANKVLAGLRRARQRGP